MAAGQGNTLGFIRELPPTLVNAFRATLEELSEADLLLHVDQLAHGSRAQAAPTPGGGAALARGQVAHGQWSLHAG
ncbi:GTP-binding protein HflX [Cystobacter fuscus DSM 2262]|uniref:GTP-binding protein HflX n=1 Tax=Cystobacter fuscus (strain ATCC 25194 / DSM 2262 / NBRC 100088 / M29) TaxID=1242864 RepID=S9PH33_CYSF2|nr:GTP-binding protein HflX [Cystobacter fuscus DSM 2262]